MQTPQFKEFGDDVIVRGKVNHSQALSAQPLEPWLLVKKDGMVKAAHCTCMAVLGEACSHTAAVLFFLKAAAEHRDSETCTDRENAWLPPYVTNVPSAQISEIDFSSAQAKKRKLDDPGQPAAKKKKAAQISKPTQPEWASFLENIKKTNVEPSEGLLTRLHPIRSKALDSTPHQFNTK